MIARRCLVSILLVPPIALSFRARRLQVRRREDHARGPSGRPPQRAYRDQVLFTDSGPLPLEEFRPRTASLTQAGRRELFQARRRDLAPRRRGDLARLPTPAHRVPRFAALGGLAVGRPVSRLIPGPGSGRARPRHVVWRARMCLIWERE